MKYDPDILIGFLDAIRPVPVIKVSEWADTYRRLTSESAAEPGRWSTDRTPYLREIMDEMSPNSPVNEIVVVKGVQLGFTESALNAVGCYIDIDPCSIMYVMPTLELADAISESRVDPMILESPSLRDKVRPSKERDAGNTKRKKRFPGGVLVLSGANSASSLRSRPVRLLILDEVDAYPHNLDDEGSPISLAEKRTSTYGAKKKIYKLSTPLVEGTSVIQESFSDTDQRKFMVPCPHCGHEQHLIFDQLKWDKGKYNTAQYCCIECACLIDERFKTTMMAAGKWVPTVPGLSTHTKKGYHINSLYSPLGWLSWADIAKQYDDALKKDNLMQVFVNTILGETYKQKGESPEWQNLYNRREKYMMNKPPVATAFITAGVDIQKDRIEVEIVGWCEGKISYSIDYRVLVGDTSAAKVWDELAAIVGETWTREDGAQLPLRLMAVDSGYQTTMVYSFCQRFDMTRVIPTKGQEKQQMIVSPPRQVNVTQRGKKIGSVKLWNVGVSIVKSELYGWLRQEIGEDGTAPIGYCHFPEYDQHFFKMLTAEQTQTRIHKGYPIVEWVKKYERNEALDCRVYARAAANVVGMDIFRKDHWQTMRNGHISKTPDSERKPKRKSSFW